MTTSLIVGLGNPDPHYQKTWHNIGFQAVDLFYKKHQADFKNFAKKSDFNAVIAEGRVGPDKVIIVKPDTYMNNSGQAVSAIMKFFRIDSNNLIVIHDEIDLPIGTSRVSANASAAGHKGVQSIINQLNHQTFNRVRIGIRPASLKIPTDRYVLQKISLTAKLAVAKSLASAVSGCEIILNQNVTAAMNQLN